VSLLQQALEAYPRKLVAQIFFYDYSSRTNKLYKNLQTFAKTSHIFGLSLFSHV